MSDVTTPKARRAQVLGPPSHLVAEIIDDRPAPHPRPGPRRAPATSAPRGELVGPLGTWRGAAAVAIPPTPADCPGWPGGHQP
ncbi:MAG: hypothetical protein ACFCBW_01720 [Candidatus Competibacterales bacterium]